jgi:glycine hydroxymethyltransferase
MILCKEELGRDIDRAVFPGLQGGPLEHVVAAKAVCLKEAMGPSFKDYQRQTKANALVLARELSRRGLRLVSGGTDNHLMLVDLTPMNISGAEAQEVLDDVGIVLNKSMIPFDKQKPTVTSGIRIGTPCVTTRGMGEAEMVKVADLIVRCLKHTTESAQDLAVRAEVSREVKELTSQYPVYEENPLCD